MTRLIGIVGVSRSGTTVLASLLASQPGFVNLGETKRIWSHWGNPTRQCGCGAVLRSCDFWIEVMARAGVAPEASTDDPAARLRRMCVAVAELTGAETLVDTSKSPAYFKTVARGRDWSFIHMVRDPRGSLASSMRGWRGRGTAEPATPSLAESARHSLWWQRDHAAAILLCRKRPHVTVRYEDFVTAPGAIIEQVTGSPPSKLTVPVAHVAAGNPSRHETGEIEVVLDAAWRGFPPTVRAAGYAAGLPLTVKYGYKPMR